MGWWKNWRFVDEMSAIFFHPVYGCSAVAFTSELIGEFCCRVEFIFHSFPRKLVEAS